MSKKVKNALNEKMQTKLPQSLEKENILELINNEEPDYTEIKLEVIPNPKKKSKTKKLVPIAASLAIVIGLLSIFGNGSFNKKITNAEDITEVVRYQSYDNIYAKFDELHKDARKDNIFNLFGATEEVYNTSADMMTGAAGSADADTALPESSMEDNTSTKVEHGTTNNQEAGVEEGDIIKTDGKFLYVANQGDKRVSIVDVMSSELTILSQIEIDDNHSLTEIYLAGDKLVITGGYYESENEQYYASDTAITYGCYAMRYSDTFVKVYDISDRNNPTLATEYSQQGGYDNSRMIGDKLYCISTYYVNLYNKNYRDYCIPETTINGVCDKISADCISVIEESNSSSYAVITTLDINEKEPESEAVLGNCEELYASAKGMFLSETVYENSQEYTRVYRFEYTETGVNYKCMGKVPGYINDQFSMNYDGEYFRIATTQNKVEEDGDTVTMFVDGRVNNLYILNNQMQKVGSVEDLAKGETIQSARFIGDMAYVVTFRQTDPLFVIDLSDPENPTVLGELKITGFSEYLHPISDTLLLGVGQDGTEDGTNGDCKVSLFDVSDPLNPVEASKLTAANGNGIAYSPVAYNHKSFIKLSETEFAVPFSITTYIDRYYPKNMSYYICYQIDGTTIKELARYPLGPDCDMLGGTYINDRFYALTYNYTTSEKTQLVCFNLQTNEEISRVAV